MSPPPFPLLLLLLVLLAPLRPAVADAACRVAPEFLDDNFCDDLVNGCDEPLTAACSLVKRTPTFQCNATVTGEPHFLYASRLGDTICDCCDGSDEAPGLCPDVCRAEQESFLAEARLAYQDVVAGKKIRDAAVAEAAAIVAGWQAEIQADDAALAQHDPLVKKLRGLRAKEERVEAWEQFLWLREENKRKRRQQAASEPAPASSTDGGAAAEGDNEGAGDTAPPTPSKRISISTTEGEEGMANAEEDGEDAIAKILRTTTASDGTRTLAFQAYFDGTAPTAPSSSDLPVWEASDILELNLHALGALLLGPFQCLGWAFQVCKDEFLEALGKGEKPHQRRLRERLAKEKQTPFFEDDGTLVGFVMSALARGPQMALALLRPETMEGVPERLEAAMVRHVLDKVEERLEEQRGHVEELREALTEPRYGPDRAFLTWRNQCFETQDKEHTYTICPFNEVKQGYTLVGRWHAWIPREDKGGSDGVGEVMWFNEGTACWNGPKRSAVVQLWCGSVEQVVEVSEPSVCVYDFVMYSPLACTDAVLAEALARLQRLGVDVDEGGTGRIKDEL